MSFALPQHVSTTPLLQSSLVFAGLILFHPLACPATDGTDETTSLSFLKEVANLVGPSGHGILMVDSQHVSSLCIQIMFGKLSSYYSTTRNVAAAIVIAYSYLSPCLPPIDDELRSYFARTLISLSGTALRASQSQLLPHLPSLGADFLYRLVILPTDVDRWEDFSRYGRTPSLFVPVRGGGRVVMEVHLG